MGHLSKESQFVEIKRCYQQYVECLKIDDFYDISLTENGTLTLEYTEGGPACTQSKRRSNNQSARAIINFKCGKTYGGPVFIPR